MQRNMQRNIRERNKYRRLVKTLKEALVGMIVLSEILPIIGGMCEEYRDCRRMAINTYVQKIRVEGCQRDDFL